MHVDRCVFVPFTRAEGEDFANDATEAMQSGASGDAHHARNWSVVCYDDPGTPLKDLGFALTTRVLIAGHGKAGSPYAGSTGGSSMGRRVFLPFDVICDRMIEKGLQKRYLGAISCDVCYSGIKSGTTPSFADLTARYLNHRGYIALHTIGYNGTMGAKYERIENYKYHHRVVDVKTAGGEKTIKTSQWAAWKHYSGLWSVPKQLLGLPIAYDRRPPY
jgi:hypothetical protein